MESLLRRMVCVISSIHRYLLTTLGTLAFFATNHDGHFITREFKMPQRSSPLPGPLAAEHGIKHSHGLHLSTLPIPHGIKSMMSRSSEHLVLNDKSKEGSSSTDEGPKLVFDPLDIGALLGSASLCGLSTRCLENGCLQGIAWNHCSMTVSIFGRQITATH